MQELSTFFSAQCPDFLCSAETSQLLESASLKLNLNEKQLKCQLVIALKVKGELYDSLKASKGPQTFGFAKNKCSSP